MKHFIQSALLALMVMAARLVALGAETNHNFSKWEHEISAFEQMDRTNPPPKNALLFIGSSTVRMWTSLATDYPQQPVINRGFGGS